MPHVDDQFSGHLFEGDPRNQLTAAFACTWPTMPAYRFRFDCPNATGTYFFFALDPPLVELTSSVTSHDTGEWNLAESNPRFDSCLLRKLAIDKETDGFQFTLTWKYTGFAPTFTNDVIIPQQKCNVDWSLPDWNQGPTWPGSMGADAQLQQVVWDEDNPPE